MDRRRTVTVNESFARDEVLLNLDILGGDYKPGSLVAIDVVKPENDKAAQNNLGKQPYHDRSKDASPAAHARAPDASKRYICIVKDMTKDQKIKMPNVEVYVAKHIADVFGMRKGSQVMLTPVWHHLPCLSYVPQLTLDSGRLEQPCNRSFACRVVLQRPIPLPVGHVEASCRRDV